jgi:hypothetical protein
MDDSSGLGDTGLRLWFMVRGLGFRVWGSGFMACSLEFRVKGLGIRLYCSGFKV